MRSRIFKGYVDHRRFKPVEHHFRYPLYFFGFDLDELQDLDRILPLLGYNRFRVTSLYDADYLNSEAGTIKEKLFRLLETKPFVSRISRVILLTSARYFNYIFNPVSFHYCLDSDNRIVCVVAEVNNTFGEKHIYVLHETYESAEGYAAHFAAEKSFHVSPFNDMRGQYEFFFSEPEKEVHIRILLHRDEETVFEGQLWGEPLPLTPANHAGIILKNPILPHLAIPRILFEAARLKFLKKLRYYDKPIPYSPMTIRRQSPSTLQKTSMKILTGLFARITEGGIRLSLPDGRIMHFGDRSSPLQGEIVVNDYRFFSDTVLGGDVGLGESYMAGTWDTKDIAALFRVLIRNRDALANGYPTTAWLRRRKNQVLHFFRANTVMGSRKNIRSHYDLSNEFFRLFLDPSMTYSCGVYRTEGDSLEEAQRNKLDAIMRKGEIKESDHVLEIGCGWGGFAVAAAKGTGCRITGITVSEAQHHFAVDRVKREGLQERITIALTDYRRVRGLFDKIVSIEMLEAVGHKYFGTFFRCCDRLLKPGGLLVIQVITTPDQGYKEYLRETGFCQKHIFPGGSLPSVTALCEAATKTSGFIMDSLEEIGRNYSRTLHEWHKRFNENLAKVTAMGFDRPFQRKWAFYLATCEAGFAERAIGDIQVVFRKPG